MRVVIVGAGYAGLLCAFRLRRLVGESCSITVVDRSDAFVERIRLHQWLAGESLEKTPLAPWLAARQIHFVQADTTAIDTVARAVIAGDLRLPYDRLVLALGARASDALPGLDAHGFTFDRLAALRERVPALARERARMVILGGGLTGLEAATELAEAHPSLRVSLMFRGQLAPFLSRTGRLHARRALARLGVTVIEDTAAVALESRGVQTQDGLVHAEAALACLGFAPPPLARASGLAVDEGGFLSVDGALRSTSHPDVYAIGDCASRPSSMVDPLQKSCKTAMPMGAHAADAIASEITGGSPRNFTVRDAGVCVSLGRHDAVIQSYRDPSGPDGLVLTGALAVFLKERVCRYTRWSLESEARQRWSYRWLRAPSSRALAPRSVAPV
jgi:NADH dehydrogenase FAD-containing subunit